MARKRRKQITRDAIIDAALDLAARDDWESIRLHEIAAACDAGLDDVRQHFAEKDDIVDGWFDRADAAMLQRHDRGELAGLSARERLYELITTWLDCLAPYQRVTREMIGHKLEFGHVHVQFPAVLRISRTVQWIREGARLDAPLPRRALEETALTALFVKTFLYWLRDDSPGQESTRRWLNRGLTMLEGVGNNVPGGRFSGEIRYHDREDDSGEQAESKDDQPSPAR